MQQNKKSADEGGMNMKNDINIPRLDDGAPLPPFEERVASQIDWIRFYVATMERRLSSRISSLLVSTVVIAFLLGVLFALVLK